MKIRILQYKSIENLVSSHHSSFRPHTLRVSIPFVQQVAATKLFYFQAKMWTAIIFMGALQLQTFWINSCFALSSTNESLVESDEKVDLRFVTYYNLVGPVVYTRYEKPPEACNKIVKRANKPSYFQVMSHCFEERVRLLDRNKPNEMAVLEKMMRADADLRKKGVWVLNTKPAQKNNCDVAIIDANSKYGFKTYKCSLGTDTASVITLSEYEVYPSKCDDYLASQIVLLSKSK